MDRQRARHVIRFGTGTLGRTGRCGTRCVRFPFAPSDGDDLTTRESAADARIVRPDGWSTAEDRNRQFNPSTCYVTRFDGDRRSSIDTGIQHVRLYSLITMVISTETISRSGVSRSTPAVCFDGWPIGDYSTPAAIPRSKGRRRNSQFEPAESGERGVSVTGAHGERRQV